MKNTTTLTLDYRRKEHYRPRFRIVSDPPIADLYFTLRVLFIATAFYVVYTTNPTFSPPFGPAVYALWQDDGFLIMFIDERYFPRIPTLLAASPRPAWPPAHWLLIPSHLFTVFFVLAMSFFWRLTRYRQKPPLH